jgi:hypothetical protein
VTPAHATANEEPAAGAGRRPAHSQPARSHLLVLARANSQSADPSPTPGVDGGWLIVSQPPAGVRGWGEPAPSQPTPDRLPGSAGGRLTVCQPHTGFRGPAGGRLTVSQRGATYRGWREPVPSQSTPSPTAGVGRRSADHVVNSPQANAGI